MLKTSVQQLVLLLNRVPFALYITRLPYYAAVQACQKLMARHPLIKAAYARNSFALGTWVPGRSDIDLTVSWNRPFPEEKAGGVAELEALKQWWSDYEKLQRLYPMLGEVEVICTEHLLASTRFGITGFEARQWLPIYGSDEMQSGYCGEARQQAKDRFVYALGVYHHQMRGVVKSASQITLQRYVKKILRYLDQPVDQDTERRLRSLSVIDLEVLAIQSLSKRAIATVAEIRKASQPVCLQTLLENKNINEVDFSELPLPISHPILEISNQPELAENLISIFPASNYRNKVYYLVKDSISDDDLKIYLSTLKGRAEDAVVLPESLFICLFYQVDILEYLALANRRKILFGIVSL